MMIFGSAPGNLSVFFCRAGIGVDDGKKKGS
jgi:hypothetical protein